MAVGLSVAAVPAVTLACPNCYSSSSRGVINTYLLTAAGMSLLPFLMIAAGLGVFAYLRRHPNPAADSSSPSL